MNREEAFNLIDKKNRTQLFTRADEKRKKQVGDTVTYVVNRNINFTTKCNINCSFCFFSEDNKKTLEVETVLGKIEESKKKYGITEVCLQGGINPELDREYYFELIERINEDFDIHIHAFSPQEIFHISDGSVEKTIQQLKKKGLDSVPGTAAEILNDEVRSQICSKKLSTKQWVDLIKKAHNNGLRSTATIMYGHVESWEDRIDHLFKIKKIQNQTNGFTEFIPLPFVNKKGKKTTSFLEDLKMLSISRIILGDFIKNIQASWVKLGVKNALESFYFGVNDFGGTLIEENITKKEDREKLLPEEMSRFIRKSGRIPKQRNTLYEEV
ncbi:7,8-didemethyl-8-hydroxy-5-deazariboflavin synthase subunit CofH [archaeon SCG-AAA382B04]|nr:7,8-didemethyl-8-hydroxy-5-deazariboflavin synthase subunit CofH [archaeon SCG-AAA382B04]